MTRTGGAQRWGTCLTFGAAIRDAGIRCGIIHVCSAGSSLNDVGTNTWSELEKGSGYLYDRLLDSITAAMAEIQALHPGRPVRIVGATWVQGEGDSNTQAAADAYATNVENFITALLAESVVTPWIDPSIPFAWVFNKLHVDCSHTWTANLRTSQDNIEANHTANTPRLMVSVDDLTLIAGNVHLDITSRGTLGQRLAAAYLTWRPSGT